MVEKRTVLKFMMVLLVAALVIAGCNQKQPGTEKEQANTGSGSQKVLDETNISPSGEEVEKETYTKIVNLYFSDDELMEMYGLKKEIKADRVADLPKAALEEWIKGPDHEKLISILPPEIVVEYVKEVDGVAHVSFSSEILNANLGSSGEMMVIDQITLIMKQFGYDSTQLLMEGEILESLLGHVTTIEPIKAPDPEQYEVIE